MPTTSTHHLVIDGPVEVTVTEHGSADARPVLLLHGGAGPRSVAAWAERLAAEGDVRVLVPVHPGFDGTPRPADVTSPRDLAALYLALFEAAGLEDVVVVGNSIGGWIAAEMAVAGSTRVAGYVLVDAVGIEVPGHPVADVSVLSPAELSRLSFHDPDTYGLDPATLPPEVLAAMAGNRETLQVYGGTAMADPALEARLARVSAPVAVIWGESDRVVDPDYGRAFAAAIPGADFVLLAETGHLPQIERPGVLVDVVRERLDQWCRSSR